MRLLSLVFALLLALAVVDAATRRRRPGRNPARRGRVQFRRRGRQDEDVEEVDLNAVEELDEAAADEEGSGEEEIYNGCDPATNIGGFLIAKNWKAKCVEKGYTDFGPYGGVPAEEEGSGEEEAADEPEEAAAEEEIAEARRRARARRGRKAGKRAKAAARGKAVRRGKAKKGKKARKFNGRRG